MINPATRLPLSPPQGHPHCPKATPIITPSSSLAHPSSILMASPSESQAPRYPTITRVALTLPLGNQIITLRAAHIP